MIIINYKKSEHKKIIRACALALKKGKSVVYPTDTTYGLAVDATSIKSIKKLYRIKGRDFNKPVHITVPSVGYGKKIADWNKLAVRLAKNFWPGPLTLILPLKIKDVGLRMLSVNTGTIGLRMPKNNIALDLAKNLGRPITATSANLSGRADCYSVGEIIRQFKNKKYRPDIVINAGKLPKNKPSTLVRAFDDIAKILRDGPVTKKQIDQVLGMRF